MCSTSAFMIWSAVASQPRLRSTMAPTPLPMTAAVTPPVPSTCKALRRSAGSDPLPTVRIQTGRSCQQPSQIVRLPRQRRLKMPASNTSPGTITCQSGRASRLIPSTRSWRSCPPRTQERMIPSATSPPEIRNCSPTVRSRRSCPQDEHFISTPSPWLHARRAAYRYDGRSVQIGESVVVGTLVGPAEPALATRIASRWPAQPALRGLETENSPRATRRPIRRRTQMPVVPIRRPGSLTRFALRGTGPNRLASRLPRPAVPHPRPFRHPPGRSGELPGYCGR